MRKLTTQKALISSIVGLAVAGGLSACDSKSTDKTNANSTSAKAETVRIAIGTQDTTINCATGGLLIRELN
ncbi:MAG: nitrate ABC transporter substrate-binding protein, partial [Candidatus Acinetobacter avistercoris]|nr:nitrate ABC transporter substrate-binding protein [Candidatus Acinetobacter avistercoris]